ncbi:hypothetical protein [Streptomyces sp. NPDC090025]|uniref:hypothetical protein n=1 Tax=Streptomyces sp. NPDC090025 TaxID=3365922 RepID=UPI0038360CF1
MSGRGSAMRGGDKTRSGGGNGFAPRTVVLGFLLLLALVFAGSYALGAAVGPLGPGPDSHDTRDAPGPPSGTAPTPGTGHEHHPAG